MTVYYFAKTCERKAHLSDETTVALLQEIRDLLIPVSEYYRPRAEEQRTTTREKLRTDVVALLSSAKRRKAWDLADGTRSQREISKQSTLDEGSTSKLFKILREMGAIVYSSNPTRTVELGQ